MRPPAQNPSAKRWRQIRDLFDRVVDLDEPARREILARECTGDPELRVEVASLVAASVTSTGILDHDAGQLAPTSRLRERPTTSETSSSDVVSRGVVAPDGVVPGDRLGPFVLGRELGSGGMGKVFEAVRRGGGLDRRVAVKVLWTATSGDAEKRFLAEGRALAALAHPHIARVFEAGTDQGRMYLALELIEGGSLTGYCRRRGATLEQRIDLFAGVCSAVHHANREGVIHRDIKPSNILVDERGRPKLLDFGIAHFQATPGAAKGAGNGVGGAGRELLLTPAYAAPEQLLGEPVGPATDVYALGLVLYELLTGQVAQRLEGASLVAMMRIITQIQPAMPSEAFGRLVARNTPLARLRDRLRGDLDTVVMKAIRKPPDERYGSALEMAEDLRRWRDGRPILARPVGPLARAGKFLRRHVVAASLLGVALATLAASAWTLDAQRQRAEAERMHAETEAETARRISDLVLWLFASSDPAAARGEETPALELLARGEERLATVDSPEVRRTMQQVLDEARRQLSSAPGSPAAAEGTEGAGE